MHYITVVMHSCKGVVDAELVGVGWGSTWSSFVLAWESSGSGSGWHALVIGMIRVISLSLSLRVWCEGVLRYRRDEVFA